MQDILNAATETPAVIPTLNADIVRSWKDARYRRSLSPQQLQTLPDHPAGPVMLTDHELKVAGGLALEDDFSVPVTTALGCTDFTFHGWKSCGC
jgi:mersacidin/lichenicidin family type 2 lantibiotic